MIQQRLKSNDRKQNKMFVTIGRTFCLVFNRVTMYAKDHPYTKEAIGEFYQALRDGLGHHTPIVIIMSHDHFFVEDEPFDSRLNTSRMVAHFKKQGIESISFDAGLEESELAKFFRIFGDSKQFRNIDELKAKVASSGVSNVKVNYVFFKKMNSDEELILKEELDDFKSGANGNARNVMVKEVLNRITHSIVLEEFEKSISLQSLVEDPAKLSDQLIAEDLSHSRNNNDIQYSPGPIIEQQLIKLKEEVGNLDQGAEEVNLPDIAEAVFEMKAKLLAGIEEQKALGVIYENESQIIAEADDISDQVIIQLAKDEYQKGTTSVQRLGHILRRMIPNPRDLQRLLPKLKDAMLSEGMSTEDFIELMKEISTELEGDRLSQELKKGAEKIGVDSEKLIQDLKVDPDGAAELIYLASEIRNGTGDKKILTELMVDYIERMGSTFAGELPDGSQDGKDSILRDVLVELGSKLVTKLKTKELNEDVLLAVEKRLGDRIDKFISQLDNNVAASDPPADIEPDIGKTTVFQMLEESVEEGDELQKILAQVRKGIENSSIDENNFQQIRDEILKIKAQRKKQKTKKDLPNGVLNYINTLLFIEKEINRTLRYGTPFSTITFSVIDLKPEKPIPAGTVNNNDISQSIMGELVNHLRESDIVGILNKKMIVVLLPMTDGKNARIALHRIRKKLHADPIFIKDIPVAVRFAGAVTSCDPESIPDLQAYLTAAENNHNELVIRLTNLRDLM